jgi:penicillin-binding protein 2
MRGTLTNARRYAGQAAAGAASQPVAGRIAVAGVVGLALFTVLVLRLWGIAVMNGSAYEQLAEQNRMRHLPVEAERGAIVDTNGQPMVTSGGAREVVLNLQDVPVRRRATLFVRLSHTLGMPLAQIEQRIKRGAPDPLAPIVIADDVVDDHIIFYLKEHPVDFPGVDVTNRWERVYPDGTLAAHILGQVGEVTEEQLKGDFSNLKPGDHVGQSGLERSYDQFLRGTDGYSAIEVDAAGVRVGQGRGVPSTPGNTLRLSIDLNLQRASEKAIKEGIDIAHSTHEGPSADAGAAVAMDPRTGAVLALASNPTYDPNIFVQTGHDADIKRVLTDPRTPLTNRATEGLYPPGSTFKVVTATAALEEGLITPATQLSCPGSMMIAGTKFKNDEPISLGLINLSEALNVSCDTFFYQLGERFYNLPGSQLQMWANRMGLGRDSGIDIPGESSGLVPTPAWRQHTFTNAMDKIWTPGHSVNLSIGQGDLLVTPLQMTRLYSAIANGGTLYQPRLAQDIEDQSGRIVKSLPRPKGVRLPYTKEQLDAIRLGLFEATHSSVGTSSAVFSTFSVPVAGKTGTAQKPPHGDQAWFCGFAPVNAPVITACAIIENGGHGGVSAAPVVLRMFQEYFHAKGGSIAGKRTD